MGGKKTQCKRRRILEILIKRSVRSEGGTLLRKGTNNANIKEGGNIIFRSILYGQRESCEEEIVFMDFHKESYKGRS